MLKSIVVIDDYGSITGGASSVAINSAIYLADNTELNVFYFSAVGPISNEIKQAKFTDIVCLDQNDILNSSNRIKAFYKGIYNKSSANKLEELLLKLDKDNTIIHLHTWTKSLSSSIFNILAKLNFSVVMTLHDYFINCPNGGYFNYQKSVICKFKPLSFKCIMSNCDSRSYSIKLWRVLRQLIQNKNLQKIENLHFINVSEFSKTKIENRGYCLNKSTIIDNPVSFNKGDKINVVANDKFLFLGRVSEEKGIRMFCKTVADNGMKGIVIGDGPLLSELKNKYKYSIEFKGWLSKKEIIDCFKETRVLVFPSLWYETLGLTVLEAMSHGIPCIVSDNCAASEFVKNQINGLIFKSGCPSSLLEAMKKTEKDEVIKLLSNNAYASFNESKYSLKTHCDSLLKMYNSIFKSRYEDSHCS